MKRDFSETAEQSLCSLVGEINAEQWFGWTDAIGDFFSFGLNIQDYLNNVDDYHKKIIDKKNTTEESIHRIFADVRLVDASYLSIFQKCRDAVREQKEYIQKLSACIDQSSTPFSAEAIMTLMKPACTELKKAKTAYYIDKLKHGNGTNAYDYDYLKEIMNTEPSAIPEELYAALICAFNDMKLEQKEKFIECAYVLGDFWPDSSTNSIGTGKYKYQISDVFSATVAAYTEFLSTEGLIYDSNNAYINQLIGNYSLMQSVRFQGNEIYVSGFYFAGIKTIRPIDVTLIAGSKENDYLVKYSGSVSPYNEYGMTDYSEYEINTYGMRFGDGIDRVFDKQAIELSESLRVDIGQENFENVISGVSDILLGFGDIKPVVTAGMTVSSTIIGCVTTSIDGSITNDTVDKIQTLLKDGNTYKALSVNISCGICDGEYQIYAYATDKTRLEATLSVYTFYTEEKAEFTADRITEAIRQGNLEDVQGLSEFVDWYMDYDGQGKTDKYLRLEE